jgi:1-piperideine-2-carboxylate/1-pyrroline-2-carboxylate reductase [NAD(P)H]
LDNGLIHCPVRVGVPLSRQGVLHSMPASAGDMAIHKLVSVNLANVEKGLPTIFGLVTVCDGETGEPLFVLDGPTLTGRRTAALSMLGVRVFHPSSPENILLVGTGAQARYHAAAIHDLHPHARIYVKGTSPDAEANFSSAMNRQGIHVTRAEGRIPDDVDTVITVTTSKTPVYEEAARADRLIVGSGSATPDAAEISPRTIHGSDLFVDDLKGTRAEAGDYLQADVDWTRVTSIGSVDAGTLTKDRPIIFKAVGCGAWDLAACRVAREALRSGNAREIR